MCYCSFLEMHVPDLVSCSEADPLRDGPVLLGLLGQDRFDLEALLRRLQTIRQPSEFLSSPQLTRAPVTDGCPSVASQTAKWGISNLALQSRIQEPLACAWGEEEQQTYHGVYRTKGRRMFCDAAIQQRVRSQDWKLFHDSAAGPELLVILWHVAC